MRESKAGGHCQEVIKRADKPSGSWERKIGATEKGTKMLLHFSGTQLGRELKYCNEKSL
jgi:hypothetical protein